MSGILDGIRVVDMSRYISGPYCAMMLADMGAEVIKVEKPGEGEIYRVGGPWKDGVSLVFQAMNRNKKSVTADTRSPEGLQLIKELILHSDVLIENFRAGVMEKMGLGYEELHKLNPRLIMVSITGFGHSGPLRDRMAFDGIISAMSGVTRIDGDKVERSKGAIHDHMAGMNAVIGTLLALLDREKTGKGQYVDTAMIACSTVLRSDSIADAYLNGDEAAMGSDDAAPYGYLKTKDDWVNFQAGTNQLFRKLRTICPEPVVQEERWLDDLPYRVTHHAELFAAIQKWASNMTADELEKKFVDAGIPAGIVATPGRLLRSEHLWENGYLVKMPVHGIDGPVPYMGFPVKLSAHPDIEYKAAPVLGGDNEDTITTVSTLVMGILALLISLQFTNLIPLLSLAYSLINAGALIMIVGGVFWKKATKEGAIASFIVGVGLTLLNSFKIIVIPYASVLPLLPALAVFIIVSLITQPKRAATTE